MYKRSFKEFLLLSIISFCSFLPNRNEGHVSAALRISSYAPLAPIMKNLPENPAVRLAVSLPAGAAGVDLRNIHCSLNRDGNKDIERVDVYLTGAEAFSANQLLATAKPMETDFVIPIDLKVKPGVVFLWVSIVLKADASIDGFIEMHCTKFSDAGGQEHHVEQGSSQYRKRKVIAIRKAGEDGVHTYRIPGLIRTAKGTLIAVYDNRYTRTNDLPSNIDVGMSRSTDGGRSWEPMKVIMDMGPPHENNGIGDPAILYDPSNDKIWVAALWSKGNRSIAGSLPGLSPDTTGQFVLVSSTDDGMTWTAPYSVTPQVKDPAWHLFFQGPGSGIAMQDGKLVFAAQYWDEKKMPYSTIIYSSDHGKSWIGKLRGPRSNTTESQVVETTPGTLLLNMRDNRGGYRSVATTSDMGVTWTEHSTSFNALPDPVCMGSLIKANVNVRGEQKGVMFFCNPNTTAGRYNMTVKASIDLGENWQAEMQLLFDERICFGYSSMALVDNEHVGVLYEGVRDLYFVSIPVNEIIK
jgi:sialidase-1